MRNKIRAIFGWGWYLTVAFCTWQQFGVAIWLITIGEKLSAAYSFVTAIVCFVVLAIWFFDWLTEDEI